MICVAFECTRLWLNLAIKIKATGQCFPVVPCKVVLIFGSVDRVLECKRKSFCKVFFLADDSACYNKVVLSFQSLDSVMIQIKASEQNVFWYYLTHYFRV